MYKKIKNKILGLSPIMSVNTLMIIGLNIHVKKQRLWEGKNKTQIQVYTV